MVEESLLADVAKGLGMGGLRKDRRGNTGVKGLLPSVSAEAPAIPGLESWEVQVGVRGLKVVASRASEGQKFLGYLGADHMDAAILGVGVAGSVAEPAGP